MPFLLACAFVLGASAGAWMVTFVGVVMLAGRFWWPADIFRQFVWRVLKPVGLLRARNVQEDHDTPLADHLGVMTVPATVVVDQSQRVLSINLGFRSADVLREQLKLASGEHDRSRASA